MYLQGCGRQFMLMIIISSSSSSSIRDIIIIIYSIVSIIIIIMISIIYCLLSLLSGSLALSAVTFQDSMRLLYSVYCIELTYCVYHI